MRDLKPFQKATVRTVQKALSDKKGSHRFLVADEVGLGKTLVARDVIRKMSRGRKQPLVVLYVCSNLSIAAQNRKKLLEWLPREEIESAVSRVDRLTLLPERDTLANQHVKLYTLTPDTSIPMRGTRRRDGRKEERALIHALMKKTWPRFFDSRTAGYFKRNASKGTWKSLVKKKNNFLKKRGSRELRDMFRDFVRKELDLDDGMHVPAALDRIEAEKDDLEIIARLRNALAAGAIEQLHPDLVIFDEFQRFRDLLDEEVDSSAARVVSALRGDNAVKKNPLLLLSATPYRAYSCYWEDEQGLSHRKEFFDLLDFLYGRNSKSKRVCASCENALLTMEHELRKGEFDSDLYREARQDVENALKKVMCRTERALHTESWLAPTTSFLSTNLCAPDLKVFKHLVQSFKEQHRSAAPSYWNSIPYPMQTMGPGYQTWKGAESVKDRAVPAIRKKQRDQLKKIGEPPHPRLRALRGLLPVDRLALPWIGPSAPWWPLKGLWNSGGGNSSKVLIFSRFRAVPQAVASLMSFDLEAHLLSSDSIEYEDLTKRKGLQPKAGNEALLGHFYPSIFLVRNTDPIARGGGSLRLARETVEKQLRHALRNLGVRIKDGGARRRPTWTLISALERMHLGSIEKFDEIVSGWSYLHSVESYKAKDGSETAFKKMLRAWRKAAENDIARISQVEFKDLARHAMSAPGVVVGRALARHWKGALETEGFMKCIEVSWKGLRNYLSSRLFMKALTGSDKRYPEAIRRAALEGNLESVLDEHLWIASKLGGSTGSELAKELLEGLRVRTGNFFIHSLGNKGKRGRFSLRCHAAMPFTDPRKESAALENHEDGERPIRSDELRKAFNTPFWPHLLVTTSIGQEGLDFHVWCETLLHWDLCGNPVDLEQREGRINRYGGLAIRKRLSELLWNRKIRIPALTSPWRKIEKVAEKEYSDASGLSPWWVCKGAGNKTVIIDLPMSEQRHRLDLLRQQRLLYRLALGQPNQEDLLEVLKQHCGTTGIERCIGIDLSALSRNGK